MPTSTADTVRRSYDRLAPSYDERWRFYVDATLSTVMAGAAFEGHERLLDVACGTGELESRLAERWPALRIAGVDLSRLMLRRAAQKDHDG